MTLKTKTAVASSPQRRLKPNPKPVPIIARPKLVSLEPCITGKGYVATLSDRSVRAVPSKAEAYKRWGKFPPKAKEQPPAPWYTKYRITKQIIDEAQVRCVTDEGARRDYGIKGRADWSLDGVVLPHLDADGNIKYVRVRCADPNEDAGQGKYVGNDAEDADRIPYIHPRGWQRLKKREAVILIVEAEKSVLALEAWLERTGQDNLVPMAVGGCAGWKSKEHGILPGMRVCEGHDAIAALDSNAATSKLVFAARLKLAAYLQSIGCGVKQATVPSINGKVNGPDDLFTLDDGDERMGKIIDESSPAEIGPYSDHALAEKFAMMYADSARYVAGLGWHRWDGTRWKLDRENAVEMLAQNICRTAAQDQLKPAEQNKLRSRRTREAVMREAQPHLTIGVEELDQDTMLLNTPGGVVDLRTGKVRPAERSDNITKIAGSAPSDKTPERWLKFLDEITQGDKSLEAYLQRIAGYCLTGSVEEQELYFLFGTGSNGKGKFVEALQGVLGEYSATIPVEMLMASHNEQHPTSMAMLRGARLATATEVEDGSRWAEAKIKAMTGGDRLTARFMRQDFFEFMPQFKLVILGNHRPKLRNVGDAIQRRFRMIQFGASFMGAKRDNKLGEKLRAEYGGILQWAVEGCLKLQSEGLRPPTVVCDSTSDYFESQDTLGAWLEEKTVSDKKAETRSNELFADFKHWCEARGEYVPPQRDFAMRLKDREFRSRKSHGVMVFIGLRCKRVNEIASGLKAEKSSKLAVMPR